MSTDKKPRKRLYTIAAAIGLGLGTMGIAAAASTPSPAPAQQQTQITADQATETPETDSLQEPTLNGSIQAPEGESASESVEATALQGLATISSSDAETAALAAVPGGTVNSVELGNENGSVVYQVDMTDANGQAVEVKVDAGTGDVLTTESADNEAEAGNESEQDEADEVESAGAEAADDIDHQHEGEEVGNNGDGVPDANEASETEAGTNG
jgi:uncharacterized membrane protein YkoI